MVHNSSSGICVGLYLHYRDNQVLRGHSGCLLERKGRSPLCWLGGVYSKKERPKGKETKWDFIGKGKETGRGGQKEWDPDYTYWEAVKEGVNDERTVGSLSEDC